MPAVLAGCGTSRPAAPHVYLSITRPSDGTLVRARGATIAGRVRPADAEVTVAGRRVAAIGGEFSTRVELTAGANVIDVTAAAPGSVAALTAIRVSRQVVVQVPDVVGTSPDDARTRLAAAGLIADVTNEDGVLDSLLPVSTAVCGTNPAAGQDVDRGATIKVVVAKLC
jgi:beta-lactam-binding protein with PASTA domain